MPATSKHTPGPWVPDQLGERRHILTKSGYVVAAISPLYAYKKSHEANAALIAAAPDMLAMLKKVAAAEDRMPGNNPIAGLADEIRALIAKAEGRS